MQDKYDFPARRDSMLRDSMLRATAEDDNTAVEVEAAAAENSHGQQQRATGGTGSSGSDDPGMAEASPCLPACPNACLPACAPACLLPPPRVVSLTVHMFNIICSAGTEMVPGVVRVRDDHSGVVW